MKKIIKNADFKNNEIISNTTNIKGGTTTGATSVNWVITDNINGRTNGGGTGVDISNVIEDNVMV
jgi:uncharacterized protein (UPF0333 family)